VALLCGAAAVHLADLLFHLGLITGLSGSGQGRALVLLVGAVPAGLLAWVCWDRAVGCWAFLLGACAAYAADEWFLLPRLGWAWSTAVWVLPAVAAVLLRRRAESWAAEARDPVSGWLFPGAWSLLVGLAMGSSFAFIRPFLFQHVAGTRHGLRIAVMSALLGLCVGAALCQSLKRRAPRWAVATLSAAFASVSTATTFLLLPKSSAGLRIPMLSGEWMFTWWGRSIVASWAILGLLTVAFGLALPLASRKRLIVLLIAGLCAGTWLAEVELEGLGSDVFAVLADKVARHPPLQRIESAAVDPDGIWTTYRTRTLLEIEKLAFWQGTPIDRGSLWKNLEAAEIEPRSHGVEPLVLGHVSGELGLRPGRGAVVDGRDSDQVLTSFGYLASGFGLRGSSEALRARLRPPPATLRAWADPRALTQGGLRSLLATWREALPEGRFSVLIDGYSGPLLGIRVGEGAHFHVAEELTIFEAPVASAFRGDLGPPSTFDRPILEWEAAPEPSPFIHPTPGVMRALVAALAVEPGSPLDDLLRGLLIHAEAQIVRPYVVSAWDHVAVPDGEVEAYMEGMRKDDRFDPVIRHLQVVFEVLYKKREFALLVRHAEEAVARRPDVFAFHRTLGKAYHDILDFPNAIEELTLARGLKPDHHEVVLELSRALGAAKRWGEAVALLEAERARSDDPAVLKGLGIALLEAGEVGRAADLLRDVNARYPGDIDVMKALDRLDPRKK
jgi:hypothetical protein